MSVSETLNPILPLTSEDAAIWIRGTTLRERMAYQRAHRADLREMAEEIEAAARRRDAKFARQVGGAL